MSSQKDRVSKTLQVRADQVKNQRWDNLVWEVNRMVQTMYDAETGIADVFQNPDGTEFFWYKNVYEVDQHTLYFLFLPDVNLLINAPRAIFQYYNPHKHTKIVLDFSIESPLMWPIHVSTDKKFSRLIKESGSNIKPFFQIVHEIILSTGIPSDIFEMYTANPYIAELYAVWCDANQISNRILVGYRELWAANTLKDEYLHKYIKKAITTDHKAKYYTCLNNRPRAHRVQMICELYDNQLLDQGIVTFVFDGKTKKKLKHKYPALADQIPCYLEQDLNMFNLSEHIPGLDQYYSAILASYYDVITETQAGMDYNNEVFNMFFPQTHWRNCFFTEKIWRSILLRKPFLLVGNYRQLETMRDLGFKTFDSILFDESYDLIKDDKQRVSAVVNEIKRVNQKYTLNELHSIITSSQVQQILDHNAQQVKRFADVYSHDLNKDNVKNLSVLSYRPANERMV
jgi:hypothetical protein